MVTIVIFLSAVMEASSWVRWPGAVDRGMGVEFLRKDTEYSMAKAFLGVNACDGVDFPEGKAISDWPVMGKWSSEALAIQVH